MKVFCDKEIFLIITSIYFFNRSSIIIIPYFFLSFAAHPSEYSKFFTMLNLSINNFFYFAREEVIQLSESMMQASALLADEDVDEKSPSRRTSTFLNVVALGNVISSLILVMADRSAKKNAYSVIFIGLIALPVFPLLSRLIYFSIVLCIGCWEVCSYEQFGRASDPRKLHLVDNQPSPRGHRSCKENSMAVGSPICSQHIE
ncbi:Dynamin-2A [Platanthera guangdongensis]|uniref:Dynamin-2A n=1 Tax=Platanthera guangdongensis TaxID=2320717 RepID=A0ABR2LVH2_9ASPA